LNTHAQQHVKAMEKGHPLGFQQFQSKQLGTPENKNFGMQSAWLEYR